MFRAGLQLAVSGSDDAWWFACVRANRARGAARPESWQVVSCGPVLDVIEKLNHPRGGGGRGARKRGQGGSVAKSAGSSALFRRSSVTPAGDQR